MLTSEALTKRGLDAMRTSNVIDGRPLILENVQADASIIVYIGVEHCRNKTDLGWLVWVLLREFQLQSERAPFPWRIIWPVHVLLRRAARVGKARTQILRPAIA